MASTTCSRSHAHSCDECIPSSRLLTQGLRYKTSKTHSLSIVEAITEGEPAGGREEDKAAADGGTFVDQPVLLSGLMWNYFRCDDDG